MQAPRKQCSNLFYYFILFIELIWRPFRHSLLWAAHSAAFLYDANSFQWNCCRTKMSYCKVEKKAHWNTLKPLQCIPMGWKLTVQRRSSIGWPFLVAVQRGICPRKQWGAISFTRRPFWNCQSAVRKLSFCEESVPEAGNQSSQSENPLFRPLFWGRKSNRKNVIVMRFHCNAGES